MPEELRLVSKAAPASLASPTMRDLLAVMFRQRRLVLFSFVGIFVTILCYGMVGPLYESEMKFFVHRGRVDPVVTSTPSQAQFEREGVTEEELNSEVELLHDEEILRSVVRKSGLISEGQSWFWDLFGDNEDKQLARAARRINKHLRVEAGRKTTLINLSYKSSNPAQSAEVLRSLASVYLDRHQQVHRPSGEFNFFDQQVTQSRRALEDAELQLMSFTRDQDVVSPGLERDITLQKLGESDADARQTRVAITETSERIRILESKLNTLGERVVTQVRNSDNPQLMEKMKARLLDLGLKRTELLTKYEPTYRLVQEVDQQIAQTRASIAGGSSTYSGSDQRPKSES